MANFAGVTKGLIKINIINIMKQFTLYATFALAAEVVLLNRYTPFHINNSIVHFIFLFVAATAFVIIIGRLFKKLETKYSIIITVAVVGILCFTKAFLTWGGDWQTQTILYRNIKSPNQTINFQMRGDRFAFGYKKRIVDIQFLAPFMEWTSDVDTLYIDKSKWKKVNLELNELRLPDEK
jgi:hypothetical protein